ncbi:hypothetical protein HK104_010633, partial [Borealophlyctis nickersoniae]
MLRANAFITTLTLLATSTYAQVAAGPKPAGDACETIMVGPSDSIKQTCLSDAAQLVNPPMRDPNRFILQYVQCGCTNWFTTTNPLYGTIDTSCFNATSRQEVRDTVALCADKKYDEFAATVTKYVVYNGATYYYQPVPGASNTTTTAPTGTNNGTSQTNQNGAIASSTTHRT